MHAADAVSAGASMDARSLPKWQRRQRKFALVALLHNAYPLFRDRILEGLSAMRRTASMSRRAFVVAGAALSLAIGFSGMARAQDVIKVGAPLPLTGPLSPEGIKQQQGNDLWAETANAKGCIKVGGNE